MAVVIFLLYIDIYIYIYAELFAIVSCSVFIIMNMMFISFNKSFITQKKLFLLKILVGDWVSLDASNNDLFLCALCVLW